MELRINDAPSAAATSLTSSNEQDFLIVFEWQAFEEDHRADEGWNGPFNIEVRLSEQFSTRIVTNDRRVGFVLPRNAPVDRWQMRATITISKTGADGQPNQPISAQHTFAYGLPQPDPEMLRTAYTEHGTELRRTRTLYETFLVAETIGFAVLVDRAKDVQGASPKLVFGFSLGLFVLSLILAFLMCELATRYHRTHSLLRNIESATRLRRGNWAGELVPTDDDISGGSAKHWLWAYLLIGYTALLSLLAIYTLSRSTLTTVLWAIVIGMTSWMVVLHNRRPTHARDTAAAMLLLASAAGIALLVLAGSALLAQSPQPVHDGGTDKGKIDVVVVPVSTPPGAGSTPATVRDLGLFYAASILLFGGGLIVAVFSKKKGVKAAGTAAAIAGLSILPIKDFTLFGKLIDKMEFNFKVPIDVKIPIDLVAKSLQPTLESSTEPCPVGPFLEGTNQLSKSKSAKPSDDPLSEVNKAYLKDNVPCLGKLSPTAAKAGEPVADDVGLLVLIGHVDKRELHGSLQRKFGSNITLAYQRALVVRDYLVLHHPAWKNRVIVTSAGPRHIGFQISPAQLSEDRFVEVVPYRLRLETKPAKENDKQPVEKGSSGGSSGLIE